MAAPSGPVARVVLQQCLHAKLQVQPASESQDAKYVEIERGLVVYVCFLKGSEQSIVDKMVKTVLSAKLSEDENGKYVSIMDLPGNVIIIPQATLGGKLKGKMFQYHNNIDKSLGEQLYSNFVKQCEDLVSKNPKQVEGGCIVKFGTYGNRQVLSLDTNGPYSHHIEF